MIEKKWAQAPTNYKFFSKSSIERRASARYPIEALVKITAGSYVYIGKTSDICEDGFLLNSEISSEFQDRDLQITLTYVSSEGDKIVSQIDGRLVANSLIRIEVLHAKNNLELFLTQIWDQ